MRGSSARLPSGDSGGLFGRLRDRYGFAEDPLDMELPFFSGGKRGHVLETLRHLAAFGDLVLLLSGASGSGKTRLLAELVRHESSELEFHRLPASSLASIQALARTLNGLAGRTPELGENPREGVFEFFRWSEARGLQGRRLVLLVDDAGLVPPELLKLLFDAFLAANRALAALPVISGEGALGGVLGLDEDGRSTVVYELHLHPLTVEEIAGYLAPRLKKAGCDDLALLARDKLMVVHRLSHGSFSGVRRYAAVVWLDMVGPVKEVLASSGFRPLHWLTVGLLLVGSFWWFAIGSTGDAVRGDAGGAAVARADASPVEVPSEYGSKVAATKSPLLPSAVDPGPVNGAAAAVEQVEVPLHDRSQGEVVESVANRAADATTQTDVPVMKAAETGFAPAWPERFTDVDVVRAGTGVTVQFVAGLREQTALRFIEENEGIPGLRYTRSVRQGHDWFIVFYGAYGGPAEAGLALADLPEELSAHEVWFRPFSDF